VERPLHVRKHLMLSLRGHNDSLARYAEPCVVVLLPLTPNACAQYANATSTAFAFTTPAGGAFSAWTSGATFLGPKVSSVVISTTTPTRALAIDNLYFYP
jgi:hypothetical protein